MRILIDSRAAKIIFEYVGNRIELAKRLSECLKEAERTTAAAGVGRRAILKTEFQVHSRILYF